MTKTENLGLPQWAAEDPIRREEFNAAFAAVEEAMAGGLKLQSGSYVGTGKFGSANPNSLSFDFAPKILILSDATGRTSFLYPGLTTAILHCSNHSYTAATSASGMTAWATQNVTWSSDGKRVSWHALHTAWQQYNDNGVVYRFYALG
jgi:hypothetical protein